MFTKAQTVTSLGFFVLQQLMRIEKSKYEDTRTKTIDFYANLRRNNLLSKYILFDKIKYRNIKLQNKIEGQKKRRCTDLTGGFIHKESIKETYQSLKIPKNTFLQRLSDFKRLGWIIPFHTGYQLISWKKIADSMGVIPKKLIFKEKNKSSLNKRLAYELINNTEKQQIFKVHPANTKKERKNNVLAHFKCPDFSLSIRTLAYRLGFKSAMTGLRLEKSLKKSGHLKIEKRNKHLCSMKDFSNYLLAYPEIINRFFFRETEVFERLCNNLIIIKPSFYTLI